MFGNSSALPVQAIIFIAEEDRRLNTISNLGLDRLDRRRPRVISFVSYMSTYYAFLSYLLESDKKIALTSTSIVLIWSM